MVPIGASIHPPSTPRSAAEGVATTWRGPPVRRGEETTSTHAIHRSTNTSTCRLRHRNGRDFAVHVHSRLRQTTSISKHTTRTFHPPPLSPTSHTSVVTALVRLRIPHGIRVIVTCATSRSTPTHVRVQNTHSPKQVNITHTSTQLSSLPIASLTHFMKIQEPEKMAAERRVQRQHRQSTMICPCQSLSALRWTLGARALV